VRDLLADSLMLIVSAYERPALLLMLSVTVMLSVNVVLTSALVMLSRTVKVSVYARLIDFVMLSSRVKLSACTDVVERLIASVSDKLSGIAARASDLAIDMSVIEYVSERAVLARARLILSVTVMLSLSTLPTLRTTGLSTSVMTSVLVAGVTSLVDASRAPKT
jgi:hypothetical protein